MNDTINAVAVSVQDIFLPTVELRVPSYQRGYSWTLKEAENLLSDILDARSAGRGHFLGAMVVVCDDASPIRSVDILDGQQRLTTLTILFAILRDLTSGRHQRSLHALIGHSWQSKGCQRTSWRLNLARVDMLFFREVIQEIGASGHCDRRVACSESRANILAVVEYYRSILSKMSDEERVELAKHIRVMCSLVLVKILDKSSAIDVFRALNTRGIQLCENDVLKSEILEKMSLNCFQEQDVSDAWSNYNEMLGNTGFDNMLKCIRTIYDPHARGDMIEGYRKQVLTKCSADVFIKDMLPVYADAFMVICGHKNRKTNLHIDTYIRGHINFIRSLDHIGWRPPILKYLVHHSKNIGETRLFMELMEILAFAMQLIIVDRDTRTRRYRRVMESMDSNLFDPDGPLRLTREEKNRLVERLRGRINSPRQRRAIALRINAVLPDGEMLSPEADATLEHVLPRHPRIDSSWMKNWSRATQRRELTDCLGNFALLTRKENQRADRGSFSEKRAVFFASGPGAYALTRDLGDIKDWTPQAVCERRDRLVLSLAGAWGLLEGHRKRRAAA